MTEFIYAYIRELGQTRPLDSDCLLFYPCFIILTRLKWREPVKKTCKLAAIFLAVLLCPQLLSAGEIPADAKTIVDNYQAFEAGVMKKAADEMAPQFEKMIADLQSIQDKLTKAGDLDGAVTVRNKINEIKTAKAIKGEPVLSDPGVLQNLAGVEPGKTFLYRVKGKTAGGNLWGTDKYTTDSSLAMACVHAGVLKDGEEGIVRVTFVPGEPSYSGTLRNGVKSESWGSYQISFKVEAVVP
jgi:hypothetical protein